MSPVGADISARFKAIVKGEGTELARVEPSFRLAILGFKQQPLFERFYLRDFNVSLRAHKEVTEVRCVDNGWRKRSNETAGFQVIADK